MGKGKRQQRLPGAATVVAVTPEPDYTPLPDEYVVPPGWALRRLPGLAQAVAQLQGDLLAFVRLARGEGASWADIGTALGITKQGAMKRYAAWVDGEEAEG